MARFTRHILHIAAAALLLLPLSSLAQEEAREQQVYTQFGDVRVLHTVFSSSFLQPEVAATYGFKRAGNQMLVNVAVVRGETASGGLPVKLSGEVSNLMQQKKTLQFTEIHEKGAVYYLAPLRLDADEVLHFHFQVELDGKHYDVNFDRKLYRD